MVVLKDIAGNRYGRLVVIDRAPKSKRVRWNCKCDCGKYVVVVAYSLSHGNTNSCGCLRAELSAKRETSHGMHYSDEYKIYSGMKNRCYNSKNKSYAYYGGRGIKVCERWLNDFAAFFADMGKRPSAKHSLDRVNVHGNYEPSNCRWVTLVEQSNNTRRNMILPYGGVTDTVANWSRLMGVNRYLIYERLRRGWDVEDALLMPSIQASKRATR